MKRQEEKTENTFDILSVLQYLPAPLSASDGRQTKKSKNQLVLRNFKGLLNNFPGFCVSCLKKSKAESDFSGSA